MKITLDISDGVVCAFLNGVRFTATGAEMFSHQLDGDDLIDGNTIKLPREVFVTLHEQSAPTIFLDLAMRSCNKIPVFSSVPSYCHTDFTTAERARF